MISSPVLPIRTLLQNPDKYTSAAHIRAVVEHPSWYVPAGFLMADATEAGHIAMEHLIMPANGKFLSSPEELWMFSDIEAVKRAPMQIGFASISGRELCARLLRTTLKRLVFNPSVDALPTLELTPSVVEQLAHIGRAVPFESMLMSGTVMLDQVWAHRTLIILLDGEEAVTMPFRGASKTVLTFTANDCLQHVLGDLYTMYERLEVVTVSGFDFLTKVLLEPIDSILFNVHGGVVPQVMTGPDVVKQIQQHVREQVALLEARTANATTSTL